MLKQQPALTLDEEDLGHLERQGIAQQQRRCRDTLDGRTEPTCDCLRGERRIQASIDRTRSRMASDTARPMSWPMIG
jgi:hypothetical protein